MNEHAAEAVTILQNEKTEWETATAFVTEKVAFQMRNVIRKCRKNYWGIFDEPYDRVTNLKKTWVPLTESMVESSVKNIDLDTKDVNFRAKNPSAIGLTRIIRSLVRNELDRMNFGELLDESLRALAIDGTVVWYTGEKKVEGKIVPDVRRVDLLNFYIDPTAPCIQDPSVSVIERVLVTEDEFKKLAKSYKWINTDQVKGTSQVTRNDGEGMAAQSVGEVKLIEIFKRYGKAPKSILTGKKEDKDTDVDLIICCSGNNGKFVFHGAESYDGKKPYEEMWYTRVPGRWYGKGIAEKLLMLQEWMNTIVNIRINRSRVAQLGIFKIKKTAGITPQMVSRLASNGAILVNDQDDIEQFQMQEASQASYADQNSIEGMARQVTASYEVVTGEQLPASTTATAIGVQTQTAQSQFVLIKEGVGMFIQRWIKNHALEIMLKGVGKSEIVRLTGEPDDLRQIDEAIANNEVLKAISQSKGPLDFQQVEMVRQSILTSLQSMGNSRYTEMVSKLDPTDYDVQVYVTNEEFDSSLVTKNLISILQIAPEYKESIIRTALDIMGLDFVKPVSMPQPQPQQAPGPEMSDQTPQTMLTSAVTQANGARY